MKNKIRSVSVEYKFHPENPSHTWGTCWIHRTDDTCNDYPIRTLTQYQRAVRLLNMFIERNMK